VDYVKHPLIRDKSISLRRYQESIVSRAFEASTLVVLPTGLGKTVVAAMVAAHRLQKHPDSKILFLAPTKPLVVQHHRSFQKFLKIAEQEVITGVTPSHERPAIWKNNKIIFATPQTIDFSIKKFPLDDVSLIIFDEAHRAVGDYSYVNISTQYWKKTKYPQVLALTASPGASIDKIKEVCKNLGVKVVEAKSDEDKDVKPYIKEVEIKWVKVDLPEKFQKIQKLLEDILRDKLRLLKSQKYIESAALDKINKRTLLAIQSEIRKDIATGKDNFQAASLIASAIKINHAIELLETQGLGALNEYLERLVRQKSRAVFKLVRDVRFKKARAITKQLIDEGFEHPKLGKLAEIVSKYKKKKVLIFTQYRDTVDSIISRLNEEDILAHEFIGQAARGVKKGMTQKKQLQVLDKFREGDYTSLVATSVAEEGLDIPKVDLVVFYEPVPSEIRSIQRRGRTGRTEAGAVTVLLAKGTRDEGYFWASYHKEKKMKNVVDDLKDGLKEQTTIEQYSDNNFTPQGQQAISGFEFEDSGEILVYADIRERNTHLLNTLSDLCKVESKKIDVGDFIVSDRVCIERKTIQDFLQSIIDTRLLTQMSELKRNFESPLLILEGAESLYIHRDIHPNAIRGALSSIAINHGISIIPSENEQDTANIIYQMAKREQVNEKRPVSLRGERKPYTLTEKQRYIIESLPHVSAVLADRLLKHFGSVESITKATKKQLMEVEGLGEKKAADIRAVLKHKYND
jgi:ERCC4-related helicase